MYLTNYQFEIVVPITLNGLPNRKTIKTITVVVKQHDTYLI